jgi:hypothetical protein
MLPAQIAVSFDTSSGATFGYPFVIGDSKNGVIGVSQLGGNVPPDPIYDLTDMVYSIKITRGRNIQKDTYEAGTAVIRVLDPNSWFNPQNTSSPFYGYLTPLRKVRVSATTSTTQSFLFSGYVTEYRYTYPTNQDTGYVDLYVADAFRLFQLAQIVNVTGQAAGQDTGTRINKILDTMSFPNSMRSIDTGNSLCQADPATTRTGLNALKNAEFSEQGAFYIDGAGNAIFKNRNTVVSSIAGTPIQFNQESGIPYQQPLAFAFDDKLIINQATMTRVGGSAQFAQNATSVARYFPHIYNETNLVIDTDANAANIAATYVATRQETTLRVDQMQVNLLDPNVPTDTMIGMKFFDVVHIRNVQPDGSEINKTLQVQGLNWDITPNSMKVTVTTLEPITDGFVIGSSERGIIGVSAMTY